ncbi:hypothetical protein LINPERPRIM_LOCUS18100 [Linum perenne]
MNSEPKPQLYQLLC